MSKKPVTFLVGITQPDTFGIEAYLRATGQEEFMQTYELGVHRVTKPLCLVSMYAKMCYKSLVLGHNENVQRVREIEENLVSIIETGHGSVFEHVWLNFITYSTLRT